MADLKKRFERWRAKLPERTEYLVAQLLACAVPRFEQHGFLWFDDFAGGDAEQVEARAIPLQRRVGETWSTAQIRFDHYDRPAFYVDLAELPAVCKRYDGTEFVSIPRELASVADGPAILFLKRRLDKIQNQFGVRGFSFRPRATIDAEVAALLEKLPRLFESFDRGELRSFDPKGPLAELVGLQVSRAELFQS